MKVDIPEGADPTRQPWHHRPMAAKELAAALGISRDYVYTMRRAGAPFWGRLSTVAALLSWWSLHPDHTLRKGRKRGRSPKRRETTGDAGLRVL